MADNVLRILSPEQADARYYSRDEAFHLASSLATTNLPSRLAPQGVDLSVVTTDLPTITTGTAATINGRVENANSENVTVLGRRGVWASGAIDVGGDYTGREFYVDSDFEFSWKEWGANATRFAFFVDGVRTSVTPTPPGTTTTAGITYYTKLVFSTAKRRKITILASNMAGWGAFRVPATAVLTATPPKPLITLVGDSFSAGWTGTTAIQGVAFYLAQLLGVDVQVAATGSTGYLAGSQTFGSPARIARGVERTPELLVFMGSVNDTTNTGLQAAATATFDAWAEALPGVPMIVFGVQPTNAIETVGADRAARNHSIRLAAQAHPSVIAFHDMLGMPTATPPAAYSSSATYVGGDLVTHNGAVWRVLPMIPDGFTNAAPGTGQRWELLTWALTGTGRVGATTGNGTRDLLLGADGVHPEIPGAIAIAHRVDDAIRADLAV